MIPFLKLRIRTPFRPRLNFEMVLLWSFLFFSLDRKDWHTANICLFILQRFPYSKVNIGINLASLGHRFLSSFNFLCVKVFGVLTVKGLVTGEVG